MFNTTKTLSWCYRNLTVDFIPNSGLKTGFDLKFTFKNDLSIGACYGGLPNSFTHKIFVSVIDSQKKVVIKDFIGAPRGRGFGRLCANTLIQILQECYGPDVMVSGHLFNGSGTEQDHLGRLNFWRSCGFSIENAYDKNSRMSCKVGDLIIKESYKDKHFDAYGLPYVLDIREFSDRDGLSSMDVKDALSFPVEALNAIKGQIPSFSEVMMDDLERNRVSFWRSAALTIVFLGGLIHLFDYVAMLNDFLILTPFLAIASAYYFNRLVLDAIFSKSNPYKDKSDLMEANFARLVFEWCSSHPTVIANLNSHLDISSAFAHGRMTYGEAQTVFYYLNKFIEEV